MHFFCGAWGLVCAGIFATPGNYKAAYALGDGYGFTNMEVWCSGFFYEGHLHQLEANLALAVGTTAWAGATSLAVFCLLYFFGGLRVDDAADDADDRKP